MFIIKSLVVGFLLSSVTAQLRSQVDPGHNIPIPWNPLTTLVTEVRLETDVVTSAEATATASNEEEILPPGVVSPEPTSSNGVTDIATSGTSAFSATNTVANIEDITSSASSSATSTSTPVQAASTHSSPPIGPIIGGVIGGIALLGAIGLAGLYIWRRTEKRDKRVANNDADEEDMPELPPAEMTIQQFPQEQKVELENVEKQRVEAPGDHEQLQQRQMEAQSYSNPTFRHELA